jgi:hypothetical protein
VSAECRQAAGAHRPTADWRTTGRLAQDPVHNQSRRPRDQSCWASRTGCLWWEEGYWAGWSGRLPRGQLAGGCPSDTGTTRYHPTQNDLS